MEQLYFQKIIYASKNWQKLVKKLQIKQFKKAVNSCFFRG